MVYGVTQCVSIDTLILFCDQAGIVKKDAIKIHGF